MTGSYVDFLDDQGLNYLDFTVLEAGSLFPFRSAFLRARFILPGCVYEYFSEHDGYEFLPFKHVHMYRDGVRPDSYSLIWVCRYCSFWCEVFDPLIMERHLCVDCFAFPLEIKTSFRLIVRERLRAHIRDLFHIDIE